ncbi:unnamed protein product [Pieris macdunnoughi]|uniref:Single domain-containing protein n=1 Tax=Pieris macdunnoughi TaxID=345717 RepID=A0A821RFF3_9NEOP|nr:unnamed protein product [Pieris macdunnoughi]
MFRSVVVFLAVISVTFASLALMLPDPKPDKFKDIEGCYVKDIDAVIPLGQFVPSKTSCIGYRCGEEYVTIETCSVAFAVPPCKLVKHDEVTLYPYPKCCPTIEC